MVRTEHWYGRAYQCSGLFANRPAQARLAQYDMLEKDLVLVSQVL